MIKASDLRAPGAPVSLGALNLTLGGDLRATKDPGKQIVLVGAINTIRGTYDFQWRRFEILRDGTVRFDGEPLNDLNPTLDIRTRRIIQGVEARVNVRGTLKQPDIVLSSTPPLEQADILSLIVFNQPINSLGEGQQCRWRSARSSWRRELLPASCPQSIGSALGLDTFEINTAPENGGAAVLTIGQQLGQNLYVKVEQGIGEAERRPISSSSTSSRDGCACGPTCCRARARSSQLFQRAPGQRRRSVVLLQLLASAVRKCSDRPQGRPLRLYGTRPAFTSYTAHTRYALAATPPAPAHR